MLHGQVTDNDIADSVSKWLAQATLRSQREKYVLTFDILHGKINFDITMQTLFLICLHFYRSDQTM